MNKGNVIIILLVAVIAGLGFYIYQQQQNTVSLSIGDNKLSVHAQ